MTVSARDTTASQNYTYKYESDPDREYEINFKFLGEDENISAFLRMTDGRSIELKEGTHYSIKVLEGNNNIWGSLKFVKGADLPAEGADYLCIYRNIPNDQDKRYDSQTIFSSTTEYCLDKLTMLIQDNTVQSKFLRAQPDAELDPSSLELPPMNDWAGEKVLGFDNAKKLKLYDYSNPVSNRGLRQPNEETPDPSFVIPLETRKNKVIGFGEFGEVEMIKKEELRSDFEENDPGKYSFIKNRPVRASESSDGYMSASDKEKLDGIESFAQKNQRLIGGANTSVTEVNTIDKWSFRNGAVGEFKGIAFGDGKFVIVGDGGVIFTSEDMINFGSAESGILSDVLSVTFGDSGKFLCCINTLSGFPNRVLKSDDGINWINVLIGYENFTPKKIKYVGNIYASVGSGILTSGDGIEWNLRYTVPYSGLTGICFGNGKYVSVGENIIVTSVDGINWTKINNENLRLKDITFGNGIFVAAGYGGIIATSKDGVEWILRTSGANSDLNGIVFGGGLFAAVGNDGCILTGYDGVEWEVSFYANNLSDVCYAENKYAAVGNNNCVISADAEKGRMISEKVLFEQSDWNQNNPDEPDFIKNKPEVAIKSDITNLQTQTDAHESAIENLEKQIEEKSYFLGYWQTAVEIQALEATNGDYAYCAETGTKWIYDETWEDSSVPVPDQSVPPSDSLPSANGVASAGTLSFYSRGDHVHPVTPNATGVSAGLMSAADKIKSDGIEVGAQRNVKANWAQTDPTANDYINNKPAIEFNLQPATSQSLGGVIIGENLKATSSGKVSGLGLISGKNILVKKVSHLEFTDTASKTFTDDLYAVTGSPTYGYVAAGKSIIATSADGIKWDYEVWNVNLRAVIYTGGQYIAAGENGKILVGTDGKNWTQPNSGVTNNLNGIYSDGRLYVIVCDVSPEDGMTTILTSPNGTDWNVIKLNFNNSLYAVAYGNGIFVATSANGTLFTSVNGTSWAPLYTGNFNFLRSICFGNGYFLACGDNGKIFYSATGTNWSYYTVDETVNFRSCTFGNGLYVVGSADGKSFSCNDLAENVWIRNTFDDNSASLCGLTCYGDSYVAVGERNYTGLSRFSSRTDDWMISLNY
jgi:hypothetical protein